MSVPNWLLLLKEVGITIAICIAILIPIVLYILYVYAEYMESDNDD